ncbi:hypothetical protein ACHAXA_004097 [Cyclostephanos tholiformis]|uniref:Uncharacterized protein n=1 Tax=Cyclostephanos tholiformis TaxID=382380 RepID=A0ABD3SHK5_9STRA
MRARHLLSHLRKLLGDDISIGFHGNAHATHAEHDAHPGIPFPHKVEVSLAGNIVICIHNVGDPGLISIVRFGICKVNRASSCMYGCGWSNMASSEGEEGRGWKREDTDDDEDGTVWIFLNCDDEDTVPPSAQNVVLNDAENEIVLDWCHLPLSSP